MVFLQFGHLPRFLLTRTSRKNSQKNSLFLRPPKLKEFMSIPLVILKTVSFLKIFFSLTAETFTLKNVSLQIIFL